MRGELQGCWKTGAPKETCGHCRYPELYTIAEGIARDTLAQCNEQVSSVQSEMQYKAKFVLETLIEILRKSV